MAGPSQGIRSATATTASLTTFEARARLMRDLAPGARLGRFQILRHLGQGAMGVVVAAHDPDLERDVALKVLLETTPSDERRRQRMVREARSMAKFSHPNVVTVYQIDVADDRVFLVMELVDGLTLKQWMAESRDRRDVVRLFELVAYGVDAAHQAGVVHRDLKPQNILVDRRTGTPKVTDFGLAANVRTCVTGVDDEPKDALATHVGKGGLVGTPAYMDAPALAGERPDPTADQFALAVCLHEALTGVRPFDATTLSGLRVQVAQGRPSVDPSVGPALRAVLARALSHQRTDRFESINAFGQALGHARKQDAESRPPRSRYVRRFAMLVAAIAVSGGVVAMRPLRRPPPAALGTQASPVAVVSAETPSAPAAPAREEPIPPKAVVVAAPARTGNPPLHASQAHARAEIPPPTAAQTAEPPNREPAWDWRKTRR